MGDVSDDGDAAKGPDRPGRTRYASSKEASPDALGEGDGSEAQPSWDGLHIGDKVAVVASLLTAIGGLGPWLDIGFGIVYGYQGDGWFIATGAVITALVLLFFAYSRRRFFGALISSAVAASVTSFKFASIIMAPPALGGDGPGLGVQLLSWGLPLALLSSIVAVVGVVVGRRAADVASGGRNWIPRHPGHREEGTEIRREVRTPDRPILTEPAGPVQAAAEKARAQLDLVRRMMDAAKWPADFSEWPRFHIAQLTPFALLGALVAVSFVLYPERTQEVGGLFFVYFVPPFGKESVVPTMVARGFHPVFVAAAIGVLDVVGGLLVFTNWHLIVRIPLFGPLLQRFADGLTRIASERVALKGASGVFLFLWVMIPFQGSGGVSAALISRVMGLSMRTALAIIAAAAFTSAILIGGVISGLLAFLDPVVVLAGVAVVVALVAARVLWDLRRRRIEEE